MNTTHLTESMASLEKFQDELEKHGVDVLRVEIAMGRGCDGIGVKLGVNVPTTGELVLWGRGTSIKDAVNMLKEAAGTLTRSLKGLGPQ